MQLNLMNMRIGAVAGAVVLIGAYVMCGGSTGKENIIQLDFAMYPEVFEGCEVEIDGEIVGILKAVGQRQRSGFEVGKGVHVVRVLHPEYESENARVTLTQPGEKVHLLLDLQGDYDGGSSKTMIVMEE